jgi:thiamine biosynthesis lipoprotein ApbE
MTVSVLADNAAVAEAWATATLVAGSAAGIEALIETELAGLIVTRSGQVLLTPFMNQTLQVLPQDWTQSTPALLKEENTTLSSSMTG